MLVCVGADQPSYEAVVPATIMMNKATATTERHQTITWGAAQLGIGQGVLDAVADGLLAADHDTIVFVAIWIDAAADDETAVREASRAATRAGVADAVDGRGPGRDRAPGRRARRARQPVLRRRVAPPAAASPGPTRLSGGSRFWQENARQGNVGTAEQSRRTTWVVRRCPIEQSSPSP